MKSQSRHHLIAGAGLVAAVALALSAAADEPKSAPPTASPAADTPAADPQPAPVPPEISAWIAELDDDRYLVREQATRRLLAAGTAAIDPLLEAANGERPEPADRAIWILQRLSNAKNLVLRRQTLERLVRVKHRPRVSAAARQALAEIRHAAAVAAIERLGGRFSSAQFGGDATTDPYMTVRVILDSQWRGGDAGLVHLRDLLGLRQVIIVGTDISLAGLAELRNVELLEELWLYGTKLEPEDVPKVRELLPQVEVDYRRGGLLGVGSSSPDGMGPAVVGTVQAGSAAAAAGMKVGDVIQQFNGQPVPNFKDLTKKIGQLRPGDEVKLEVLRDGKPLTFTIKLRQWQTI